MISDSASTSAATPCDVRSDDPSSQPKSPVREQAVLRKISRPLLDFVWFLVFNRYIQFLGGFLGFVVLLVPWTIYCEVIEHFPTPKEIAAGGIFFRSAKRQKRYDDRVKKSVHKF